MTSIIRQADLYKAVDRWAEKGHSVTIATCGAKPGASWSSRFFPPPSQFWKQTGPRS